MGTNNALSNGAANLASAERGPETLALPSWQAELRAAVRDPAELLRLLELTPAALGHPASTAFPLLVPRGFGRACARATRTTRCSQVWPLAAESAAADGFSADPVREQGLAAQGVIQKYPGRVLLIASGACPLHCRYCFRREFPYQAQLAARADWSAAIAALRNVTGATEAI